MREKIYNAIGMMILGSLLILLSGATGESLNFDNPPCQTASIADLN